MVLHILRELTKTGGQWIALCSCGHESTEDNKVSAVMQHRTHITSARQTERCKAVA